MGVMTIAVTAAVLCVGAAIFYQYRHMSSPIPAPDLDYNAYWGPGSSSNYKENTAIKPFDITTKPEIIADLKAQLSRPLKLHEPLEGVGFEYGFNSKYLEKVVKYWRDDYLPKWSEREAYLKQFPHFQTQIQGLNIHYIHVKPKKSDGKTVIPVILLHGWPGSVREFYELIPLLTTPNADSPYIFEVIAPSLPGYGWSQAASKTLFGPAQMSIVLRNLMLRVGHKQFVVQGGDWGSIIGSSMGSFFPENVVAYHSNMCQNGSPLSSIKMFLPQFFSDKTYADFYKPVSQLFAHIMEEMGYFHIQATKPDTIGAALTHNPVGLAAYILEKFSTWTHGDNKYLDDGGLTKKYTMDALLDNLMVYYVTNSITTSVRLYSEAFSKAQTNLHMDQVHLQIPVGCARFKHDLMHSTDSQLKEKFPYLMHSTHHRDGGHFAAMEVPKILYKDFDEFIQKSFTPRT